MSDKKYLGYSEDKQTAEYISIFAKTRGLKTSAMIRQALYEYLRRKLPKKAVTVQLLALHELVNGIGE